MSDARVLFWVQHLVGVGHQRRSAAIARALAAAGATVCYVSGGRPIEHLDLRGCEFVQLPAVRSLDMRYHTLVDVDDKPIDESFRSVRRDRLLAVLASFAPDVVVTETWPFGRGLLRFELEPLMHAILATRPKPILIGSVRDIVEQRKDLKKIERMVQRVEDNFDHILVHADPRLVKFEDSFALAAKIESRIQYTGYVSERQQTMDRHHYADGPVVVSAGGGFFGEQLLRAAIEAFALCEASRSPSLVARIWHVLVGPNLAAARFDELCAMAPEGVVVERNRDDFHELLARCSVSVSQGGYNTVVDLLALRVPAVVVAYEDEREREQAVRAAALDKLGLVRTLNYQALNPRSLARAISLVTKEREMPPIQLNLDGAQTSARLILQWARQQRQRRTTICEGNGAAVND